MSTYINSTNGIQQSQPNSKNATSELTSPKNSEIQVFNFGNDKNGNGIVDKFDFEDEQTYNLFQEKGLIGKAWDTIKNNIGKIFNLKSALAIFPLYVDGTSTSNDEIYEFDSNGRLTSYRRKGDGNASFGPLNEETLYNAYDEHGNPISGEQYRKENLSGDVSKTYEYDEQGNILKTTEHREGFSASSVEFEYNDNGDIITRKDIQAWGSPICNEVHHVYDDAGRVVESSFAQRYDRNNDGVFEEEAVASQKNIKFNYNQNNELQGSQIATFENVYDETSGKSIGGIQLQFNKFSSP